MGAIRAWNSAINVELLKKFDIKGLYIPYRKRKICSCGMVFRSSDEKCPCCGNNYFKVVPDSIPTIISINKDVAEVRYSSTDKATNIYGYSLEITENPISKGFIIKTIEEKIAQIGDNGSCNILNRYGTSCKDVSGFILENPDKFKDEISDKIKLINHLLSLNPINHNNSNGFEFFWNNEFEFLWNIVNNKSLEWLVRDDKFRVYATAIQKATRENYLFTESLPDEKTFLKKMCQIFNLPYFLSDWIKCSNFSICRDYDYYSVNGIKVFDVKDYTLKDLDLLSDSMKLTMLIELEHSVLTYSDIFFICFILKKNPSIENILQQFIVKYGILYGNKTVRTFYDYLMFARTNSLPDDAVLNIKLIASKNMENYLEKNHFSKERIDDIVNMFDFDAMSSIKMLHKKKS